MKKYNSKYEIKPTSSSVEKTLSVLDAFNTIDIPISLNDLSHKCSIAKATLLRILNTLLNYGYIIKDSNKLYKKNFILNKSSTLYSSLVSIDIKKIMSRVLKKTGQSVEILIVRKDRLIWYDKTENPDLSLMIKARVGMARLIYELDAPSRLYLNFIGRENIIKNFNTNKFFTTGIINKKISFNETNKIISKTAIDDVVYDIEGNSNGIRRYAVLIKDKNNNFLFILSVAEPALSIYNNKKYINKIINILLSEKKVIEGGFK